MKTAVSLPNGLFAQAETEAKRMGISRSELYALALGEFVERRQAANITQRLNEVYADTPSSLDPVLFRMQMLSLTREEW